MSVVDTSTVHHRVVVIGGGNAGLSVAGRLRRQGVDDIVVIEPSAHHYYQPMFSHVAGGTARATQAVRPQGSVMPHGVGWIRGRAAVIDPDGNTVVLASGRRITYDQLIVCPGIEKRFDRVPGLSAAMAAPSGISNYTFELASKASHVLRGLRRGTVMFTQPAGPSTCAGAAQKPMYLACDYWRATGVLEDIRVIMVLPDPTMFGIPLIDDELDRKIAEYGIEVRFESELLEVDAENRIAVIGRSDGGPRESIPYDVLHAVPPQSAPDWLAATSLPAADEPDGFVEVDPETLRHRRYPNVWALGDAAATTNSKSGGALRKQTVTVAKNLTAVMNGYAPAAKYDGYSVCPFTVSRGTLVFAEFDDAYQLKPAIPFWTGLARERRLTWILDRRVLPWVYWHLILQGRA